MPGPTPCTRCGAPLPETDGARVCALCGQFHEPARSGPRPRFGSGAAPGPDRGQPDRPKRARSSPRARETRIAAVVGGVIFLTVAVPLIAVFLAVRSGSGGVDQSIDGVVGTDLSPSSGDLLVLPGALDDDPEVVTMATPIGGSGRVVALVGLDEGVVWQAEVVPGDVYSAQFAATDDVVLASLGREVVGLDRATGDVLWEAEASDQVHPFCADCFALLDDTLVVLGSDGEVTAFDPGTGDVRWAHRFASVSGRVVPLEDTVLLVDDAPDGDVAAALSMIQVRPSDGSELSRFAPGCLDDTVPGATHSVSATPRLPVIPVPGTDDIVVAYGTFPSCVQRWTVTTGEQQWSRTTESRLDWYDGDDRAWALGPTDVVFAGYEGWLVVSLSEGGVREVPAPADSLADPAVTVSGDLFVGTVSSTRGTQEWSLVAHDLGSGDERWTRALGPEQTPAVVGAESSAESVYDGAIFAVLPVSEELRLLTIGPPGPRFEVGAIDPETGDGEIVGVAPVRTDSPTSVSARIDTVRDGLALVDAGGVLQVVDLSTGEVDAAWGR
ncbi:MAG TPA: PQQ-binding-like beta-propeller repeat protein [Iamia sp.]